MLLLLLFLMSFENYTKFEDVFKKAREISLSNDVIIGSIADLVVTSRGEFIISDPIGNAVLVFGNGGKFLRKIGNFGSGPGEFRSPNRIAVDEFGNIYVEDRGNRRINVYDGSGNFKFSFRLEKGPLFSLKVKGNYIYTYCPAGIGRDERVIYIYNGKGELVKKFGNLPKFMLDFPFVISGGGMVVDSVGSVYQVHPVEYVVNKYSIDGSLLNRLVGKSQFYKAPTMPDIKTIQAEYQKWLDSWTPVSGLYLLEDKFLIVLTTLGKEGRQKRFIIDIFDLEGKLLKGDIFLSLPESATIIGAYGDGFYIAEQQVFDEKGNLLNPKIIEYKIKSGL